MPFKSKSGPPAAPLDHITSRSFLAIWDEYARVVLDASHQFHGAAGDPVGAARYAAQVADAMMEERQARAAGHVEQKEAEKADPAKGKPKKA